MENKNEYYNKLEAELFPDYESWNLAVLLAKEVDVLSVKWVNDFINTVIDKVNTPANIEISKRFGRSVMWQHVNPDFGGNAGIWYTADFNREVEHNVYLWTSNSYMVSNPAVKNTMEATSKLLEQKGWVDSRETKVSKKWGGNLWAQKEWGKDSWGFPFSFEPHFAWHIHHHKDEMTDKIAGVISEGLATWIAVLEE